MRSQVLLLSLWALIQGLAAYQTGDSGSVVDRLVDRALPEQARGLFFGIDNTTIGKKAAAALPNCCKCRGCYGCSSAPSLVSRRLSFARAQPRTSSIDCSTYTNTLTENDLNTLPKNKFDVVLFRTSWARSLFRNVVHDFQCPVYGRTRWTEASALRWHTVKEDMEEAIQGYYADSYSMLALNNETACAAALYTDTKYKRQLLKHIRNRGLHCRGGGAAILCQLIRDPKQQHPPLRIILSHTDPKMTKYYEGFGCIVDPDVPGELDCRDPAPPKCTQYIGEKARGPQVYDADSYDFPDSVKAQIGLPETHQGHHGHPQAGVHTLAILGIILVVAIGFFFNDVIHAWGFIHA